VERIGDEVRRTLASSGGETALELTRITEAWPRAVGEAIARNAWPLRLGRDGTLHVATSSATWAFELDRLAGDLASRLAEAVGAAAPPRFRFRPGPIPEPSAAPEGSGKGAEMPLDVPAEVAAAADQASAEIDDPELREMVARAARASLWRSGSGRTFW
jgi:hypothetical protein